MKARRSLRYLKTFFSGRSLQQRNMDINLQAKNAFKSDSIRGQRLWIKNPNKYDIVGIDTRSVGWKKRKKTKPKRFKLRRPKLKKSRVIIKKKPRVKPRVKPKVKPKRQKFRKPKTGMALMTRMRRGQLRMRPEDLYEGQMVKRLRKQTGMTHVQVMSLVNLAKGSDYIDVETEIGGLAGLSEQKIEIYEFGKRKISKLLEREKPVSQRYATKSSKEISWELSKWADLGKMWHQKQKIPF